MDVHTAIALWAGITCQLGALFFFGILAGWVR